MSDGRVDGARVDETLAGPRVRLRAGWFGALGRLGTVVGAQIRLGQWWCPVLWDDEEDPDWHKSAALELAGDEEPAKAGDMKSEIDTLRREAEAAERKAKALREQLDAAQRACRHSWGEVRYVPEHHKGYTIPGDPPGTMGVDWRGPCEVPPTTTRRWERTCAACGLAQRTECTRRTGARGTTPGCGGEVEVPDFGDR